METGNAWSVVAAIATAVAAFSTTAAVIVALFGEWIINKVLPPKLVITLEDRKGKKTPTVIVAPDGSKRDAIGRWYHLTVRNDRRARTAQEVRIFLLATYTLDPSGGWKLSWSGEVPIRWAHQEVHPLERKIGPSASADLCSVVEGKWVQLHPLVSPLSLQTMYRDNCNLRVRLQARSLHADSEEFTAEIAWNGGWSEDADEMEGHMVVKEIHSTDEA